MAKIKFGQIVSEARGKIAGFVFSRNHAGSYARQKVSPIQPRTTAQTAVRSNLTAISKAWAGLATEVRAQYRTAVSNFKKTNVFGDSVTMTGFNLFCMLARTAHTISKPIPTTFTGLTEPSGISTLAGSCTHAPEVMNITFSPVIPVADNWIIRATPPVSKGKKFVKSEYRILVILDSGTTTPYVATVAYIALFGNIPQSGQKCFVQAIPVNSTSFRKGSILTAEING